MLSPEVRTVSSMDGYTGPEYHSPRTLEELFRLLRTLSPAVKVIAGGTDLVPDLKEGLCQIAHLVSLRRIDALRGISRSSDGALRLGALATIAELIGSREIPREFAAITEAGSVMASPAIRTLATLGGNLASAVPSADMVPILVALEARAGVSNGERERVLPLEGFFRAPRETVLEAGEIIKEIIVPKPPGNCGACYLKQGRRETLSLAVAGVAVALEVEGERCRSARIVLGAVAPTVVLAKKASRSLEGVELNRQARGETFAAAARIASTECIPISDLRASATYRTLLVEVLSRRALEIAYERACRR